MKKIVLLVLVAIMMAGTATAQTAPNVFMNKTANLATVLADKVKQNAQITITSMIGSRVYEGKDLASVSLAPGKYFLRKEDEPHTIVLIVTD